MALRPEESVEILLGELDGYKVEVYGCCEPPGSSAPVADAPRTGRREAWTLVSQLSHPALRPSRATAPRLTTIKTMDPKVSNRSAEWWRRDAERNERVRRARLRRDAAKPPAQNLEEGSALIAFTREFAAAFSRARRTG